MFYAWGKGGGPFVFPAITGVEIGSTGRMYAALQVHYNNPTNVTGLIDRSGVNVYRTNQVRVTQAGLFVFGTVNFTLLPQIPEYSVSGSCPSASTNAAIPAAGVTTISSFMHAHQRGRRMWTEVWRNGVKVNTLGDNQNYDYNLQKVVGLSPFVQLKKNDTVTTYCTYDTTKDTQNVTHGELTSNEMCFNFVYYYPLIGTAPLIACGPVNSHSPTIEMCSLLPNHPPPAYNFTDWTVANVLFKKGGNVTCKPGFMGTAVLGCAGFGAPYTFSGCVRAPVTQGPTTHSPSTLVPTHAPSSPVPTHSPTTKVPQKPSLNPAVRATLPIALLISLAILW
jgi:hypothetical protein